MRILMINVTCGSGSTGRICTDLAEALEKSGHEVKIAYGRNAVPKDCERFAVRIGSDIGVKLHALNARLTDASGFGSRAATERFIKWVKEFDPDIIHLHNIHGYYINVNVLFDYLASCGKRVIWTLHDCWAFTGHNAYCISAKCEKWETGCGACPDISGYPKSLVDRSHRNWELKKSLFTSVPGLTLVVPSKWLAGLAARSFLKDCPCFVIPNGIDTAVFHPDEGDMREKLKLGNRKVVLGVASVWSAYKGLGDLIKLRALLDPEEYAIVLVGLTKKQIGSLPDGVTGLERTDSARSLAQLYSMAHVFVNPTYDDNFPTTNLEALACGTPVVTYDTGGSGEAAGRTAGDVVPAGDVNALAESIKRLPASIETRLFTKEAMAAGYCKVYFGSGEGV